MVYVLTSLFDLHGSDLGVALLTLDSLHSRVLVFRE